MNAAPATQPAHIDGITWQTQRSASPDCESKSGKSAASDNGVPS